MVRIDGSFLLIASFFLVRWELVSLTENKDEGGGGRDLKRGKSLKWPCRAEKNEQEMMVAVSHLEAGYHELKASCLHSCVSAAQVQSTVSGELDLTRHVV